MGCDIHERRFLFDKNSKKYLDVNRRYSSDYDNYRFDNSIGEFLDTRFKELTDDRYYDFFGVMGNNSRSALYSPMKCLKYYDMEFFEELRKDDAECPDHYGFCHCSAINLRKGFQSYIRKLENGLKGNKVKEYRKDYDNSMISYLKSLVESLDKFLSIGDEAEFRILCDLMGYDIDLKKTEFVFFFDN